MKCPNCNEELEKGAKFCTKCGANIEQALAERVQAEAEAKAKEEAEMKAKIEAEAKQREEQANENKQNNTEIYDEEVKEKIEELKKEEENQQEEVEEPLKDQPKFEKKQNQPKKKKHILLKIILILILVLVILVACIYGLYKADALPDNIKGMFEPMFETVEGWFGIEKEDDDVEEQKNVDHKENENLMLDKKDKKEDIVYDYYTTELNGTTSRIPVINLENENIDKINKEILDLTEYKLKEAEKLVSQDNYGLVNVDYRWYQTDDLLSVVVALRYGTGKNEYHVFNVNVTTGEEIDNSEILDMAKIKQDEFSDKCVEAVTDYFDKLYDKDDATFTEATGYEVARSNTIDESNFSTMKTQMYLNNSGEIMIVAKIYTLAGAGEDEKLINLENKNKNVVNSTSNTVSSNTVNNTTENEITNGTSNEVSE